MRMHFKSAAASVLVATGLMLSPAAAGDGYPVVSGEARFSYGDLDLTRSEDAGQMLQRIIVAARHACGIMPARDRFYRSNPDFVTRQFRLCTHRAVADTVARLNAPEVSRLYAGMPGSVSVAHAGR